MREPTDSDGKKIPARQNIPVCLAECLFNADGLSSPLDGDRSDRHNFWKNTTAIPKSKRGEQCPVCLADIWTGRVTSCGHVFHSGCLARCLNQSSVCPMCRSNIGAITKSR
uniref:Putative RING-H2 finger protein ATL2D n=1 Tax=Magallana gigas TaxID=29159 RepID=K1PVJ8_MAGGI